MIDHKTKLILTDLDDSILEWRKTFWDYVRKNHDIMHDDFLTGTYKLEGWLKSSSLENIEKIDKIAQHFNDTNLENVVPREDAIDVVNELHLKHGYVFVGISAVDYEPKSYEQRWKCLRKHFGNSFVGLFHSGRRQSKEPYLRSFQKSIWVEDLPENAVVGSKHHNTFLLKTDYIGNEEELHNINIVSNWYDIFKRIT